MIPYIKKYPVSIAVILLVIYLSFFKPPSLPDTDWEIPHLDKVVHMGMYFVMSGMLWWEFFRSHKSGLPMRRAWIGAFLFPVLFSGGVELLQEYCTTYRGGDWLDFLANTTGALLASLFFVYIAYPRMQKKAG
ncbi:VanZ family protein [Bacteroides sp. 51]|uniref:VanZ family protein n=1 Tax=Bacteroides sp. 51 TaxID=2302938 RepID=UPI0013D37FA3|nr:VanZ family protein [Bacteroides sp. 51]NDV81040.1 VanZ family protein [Bacteroides sp. 51]